MSATAETTDDVESWNDPRAGLTAAGIEAFLTGLDRARLIAPEHSLARLVFKAVPDRAGPEHG